MGKWIMLVIVAIGGFYLYKTYIYQSPAYKAYLVWDDLVSSGDCGKLQDMADGEARAWVDTYCNGRFSAAKMVSEMRNSPAGASIIFVHQLKSEEAGPDGTVTVVAISGTGGRPSNFSRPAPPRRHEVKLKETGGTWKVLDFKDEEVKP